MAARSGEISEHLQRELRRRKNVSSVSAVDAAQWLDQARLLRDSPDRPGRSLRRLLRRGKITGARQEMNNRWFIERVSA